MREKAAVDRFEGEKAVLLVGDQGRQLVVDGALLPGSTREGDWLKVELEGDKVVTRDARSECLAVLGLPGNEARVGRLGKIGMYEIEGRILGNALKNRV